jgi:hypothetical protein
MHGFKPTKAGVRSNSTLVRHQSCSTPQAPHLTTLVNLVAWLLIWCGGGGGLAVARGGGGGAARERRAPNPDITFESNDPMT